MSNTKVDFSALERYLPAGSFEAVLEYIYLHKIQLTVKRSRSTVLGDYRHAHDGKGHRISINSDLNKYSFLITLLHEIAHLLTFEKHRNKVQPHGKEWKFYFGEILGSFIDKNVFPDDIRVALIKSIKNPSASSCSDEVLLRTLKNYDLKNNNIFFIEELKMGEVFEIKGARVFIKGEKIRKRYKCKEIATGKWYLFSPVSEVKKTG